MRNSTSKLLPLTVLLACPLHAATLTGLWQFEETSGIVATDSVAALNGDLVSGADLNATGKNGSGIDFSADVTQAARVVTSTVAGHAATQPTGDFSILVWIKPTAADLVNTFNRFIDTSSNAGAITTGYRLMTNSGANSDNFRFLGDSGANTSVIHTRNLVADTWALLIARYDTDGQATVNVLFDGDSVDSAFVGTNNQSVSANGPIIYNPGENTNFGSMDTPTIDNNDFEGVMDDAAFFSDVLTDEEVATAFNSGAATFLAVPEPSGALLALSSLFVFAFRRHRA